MLVPGSHMFLNHYGMWFPSMNERLLRKNTQSVQKLKWFSFPPLLPQVNVAEASSCPEAVPGIIFRPVYFSLHPANTYKFMFIFNLPASKHLQQPSFSPPEVLPTRTKGDKRSLSGDPLSAAAPHPCLCMSCSPHMKLLLQWNSLPKRCAKDGRWGRKEPRRRHPHLAAA